MKERSIFAGDESRTHHVAITHAADYEFVAEFTDVPESVRQGIPVTVAVKQPEIAPR